VPFRTLVLGLLVATLVAVGLQVAFGPDAPPMPTQPASGPSVRGAGDDGQARAGGERSTAGPINTTFPGLTTFRGNASRSYYGRGPVPRRPKILWRYPPTGGLCSRSKDLGVTRTWCGTGWTGQPNVLVHGDGEVEVRIGAYDGSYHFLDGETGEPVRPALETGDLAKGSATSDPDGYPLYYAGSRDNLLRVVAMDRARPTVLWSINAKNTVVEPVWNNDWDGAALIVDDYLLEGGENSYFYVVKLNRGYDARGRVSVDPEIVLTVPGFDDRLLKALPDDDVSIESSVSFRNGVAYFANSGGLVQGWDISEVLQGGDRAERVFRFWTGDDTDASVVIDDEGFLYVASELQRFNARARRVGQLVKLDPSRPDDPLVWSVAIPETVGGLGGTWGTPAISGEMLYVSTNAGELLGVDRERGRVRWHLQLRGPMWSSPVPVGNVLLQGDCGGVLHAYDISDPPRRPEELWALRIGGCIESTPAVWDGMIYVGTRAGGIWGVGGRSSP